MYSYTNINKRPGPWLRRDEASTQRHSSRLVDQWQNVLSLQTNSTNTFDRKKKVTVSALVLRYYHRGMETRGKALPLERAHALLVDKFVNHLFCYQHRIIDGTKRLVLSSFPASFHTSPTCPATPFLSSHLISSQVNQKRKVYQAMHPYKAHNPFTAKKVKPKLAKETTEIKVISPV